MERWWPTWCPSTMLWQENTDKITLTHPAWPAEDLWPLCGNPLLVSDDGRLHHLGAYHHPLGLCFLPTSLFVWCSCEEILLFPWGTAQLLLFWRMSFDHRVTGPPTSLSQFLPVPFFIAYLSTDQIRVGRGGMFWGEWASRKATLSCFFPDPDERVWGLGQSLVKWSLRICTSCPGVQFCWILRSTMVRVTRGSLGNWFPDKGFIALYSWSPGKKEDGHPKQKQLSGTEGNVCIKQWRFMRTWSKVSFRASGVPWLFDLRWLLSFCSHLHALFLLWPTLAFWLLLCTPFFFFWSTVYYALWIGVVRSCTFTV